MIELENQLYLEFPSKMEYVDFVSSKVIASINSIAQEVHSQNMLDEPSPNQDITAFGFGMNLSIDEALKNAIIHGNKNLSEKKVVVSYYISKEKLEIVVRDQGPGFDHKDFQFKSDLDAESGRGLLLIKNFMDEVIFNDSGNEIKMVKYTGKRKSREDF